MEYTKEYLEELAERFGKVPSGLTQKAHLVPAYFSEEEYGALKYCPRSYVPTVITRSDWPKIGGRRTYPQSALLNEQEKADFKAATKAYREGHPVTKGTSVTVELLSADLLSAEMKSVWATLKEAGATSIELNRLVELYQPRPEELLTKEMFKIYKKLEAGGASKEELNHFVVTMRKPSEKRRKLKG